MKNNRKISVLVSAAMAAVMLASCGGNGGSGETDVTSSAGSVQESEMSETEASIADNFSEKITILLPMITIPTEETEPLRQSILRRRRLPAGAEENA